MATPYKIVVTGMFNAGKTTFVNTLSQIETVNTDKTITQPAEAQVKSTTTVALDYGKVKLKDDVTVHLFGTPGQKRFEFMRDLLADGMHGFIFLVDSTDRLSLQQVEGLLARFQEQRRRKRGDTPYLLAANKADQPGLSLAEIREQLNLAADQALMPCVATNIASARAVVERLIAIIEGRSL